MWVLAAFVLLPILEIVLFIQVGGAIGVWGVLGLLLLAAVAGVLLIKWTGMQAMADLRLVMDQGGNPAESLVNKALLLAAGALLVLPGFLSDAIALLLLLPPVRTGIFGALKSRAVVSGFGVNVTRQRWQDSNEDVIDGEFSRIDPDEANPAKADNGQLPRH